MKAAILDLGKTNTKLALVDTARAVELDVLSTPTPMKESPFYRHFDVAAIERFFLDALRTLEVEHGVDALGVTTHGATVALLDAGGDLALPVLDYEDTGPESCRQAYDSLRPPFSETGSPRLPNGLNVGAQLFWQQTQFPDAFATVRHILTWPQFWVYRLCGQLASEATSLGCHTDLYEPNRETFSSLARHQGWADKLPPIRPSGQKIGPITAEVARHTSLSPETPVHVGIHDSNASLVPHLLDEAFPSTVVSTGTWVIVMALGSLPPSLDPTRDTLINVNAFGMPVPSARFMGGREYEQLSRPDNGGVHDHFDEQALDRVIDANAWLLPAIVHGSGPYPERESHWSVPEATLDDGMHAVVVAHYLAMMTLTCMELIGSLGTITVEGPFADNRHYMAMLGAASGRPVTVGAASTGTSVGTAMLIDPPSSRPPAQVHALSDDWSRRLRRHADLWLAEIQR